MNKWTLYLLGSVLLSGCAGMGGGADSAGALYADLGREYLARGQLELAMDKFDRALEAAPNDGYVLHSYALLHDQLGEFDQAQEKHRDAIESDPDNTDYLNAYGASLCTSDKGDEGVEVFLQAANEKLNDRSELAWDNASLCAVRLARYEDAIQYAEKSLEAAPWFDRARLHMADALARSGRAKEAMAEINQYHRDPKNADPQSLWLAMLVAGAAGDKQAAADYKAELFQRFPESKPALSISRGS